MKLFACLFLAAAADAAITRFICNNNNLTIDEGRPKNVVCAYRGSLRDEAANPPYLDVSGYTFVQCRDSCLSSTKCQSWAYTGQTVRCRTWRRNINRPLLQEADNTTGTFFWNIKCFNKPTFLPINALPGGSFATGIKTVHEPEWKSAEDNDAERGRVAEIYLTCNQGEGCGQKRLSLPFSTLCPFYNYTVSYDVKFLLDSETADVSQRFYASISRRDRGVVSFLPFFVYPQRQIVVYLVNNQQKGQIPNRSWFRHDAPVLPLQEGDQLDMWFGNAVPGTTFAMRLDNVQARPLALGIFDT